MFIQNSNVGLSQQREFLFTTTKKGQHKNNKQSFAKAKLYMTGETIKVRIFFGELQ